jgi:peptide/nickel transport system permease protein
MMAGGAHAPATAIDAAAFGPSPQQRPGYLRVVLQQRPTVVGLALVLVLAALAIFAPLLSPYDPMRANNPHLLPMGAGDHYLGTTALGRDLFAGIAHGARVSLTVGLLVALLSTVFGIAVGAVAGYAGGWFDDVLMRVTDLFMIVPRFFLALLVVAIFGSHLALIIGVLAVLGWPAIARVVRADYLSLKEREFVQAARLIGCGHARIIVRQILPNALAPAMVVGSLQVSQAILAEASLAFLGLGDPSLPSWGQLIVDAQSFLRTAPWLAICPGVAVTAAVVGFNLIGDGLARALDPRSKEGTRG